jgi:hypothetical protein
VVNKRLEVRAWTMEVIERDMNCRGVVECCCWRKISYQHYGRVLVSQIRLLDFLVQKLKGQLIWRETANPVFLDYRLLIGPGGRSEYHI